MTERVDEPQEGNASGSNISLDAGDNGDDSGDDQEHQQDCATEQRASAAATQQTLLVQLQRSQGTQMQLRAVPRADYSGMGS